MLALALKPTEKNLGTDIESFFMISNSIHNFFQE